MKKYGIFHYLSSNVELSTLKYLSRRMKRYRAEQRYRTNFFIFFWRDHVAPGERRVTIDPRLRPV